VLQNAFANSSSSLVQSKMTGNIIFVLLPPLAYWESSPPTYWLRSGGCRGAAVLLVTLPFVEIEFRHPLWIVPIAFSRAPCWRARDDPEIWAEKIDQVAAFRTSHMPLTFFRSVYSIHSLPFLQGSRISTVFFYMMTGSRTVFSASRTSTRLQPGCRDGLSGRGFRDDARDDQERLQVEH